MSHTAATERSASTSMTPVESLWPMPHHISLSMDQQFDDWMTNVGSNINHHLGTLSHDMLGLRFDGRTQHLGLHAGVKFLSLDEDIHVVDNVARIRGRLMIEAGSRALDLRLPTVEVQPDDFRGERIVQLRVPLVERHW